MKKILFFLAQVIALVSLAQTGPGGVGNASDNIVWLDAARLGLANNTAVSSWTDLSGNNNHAIQATGAQQPIFKTGQINGVPAVDFDGVNDFLQFTNHITTSAISAYSIHKAQSSSINGVFSIQKHLIFSSGSSIANTYEAPTTFYPLAYNQNDPTVFQFHTSSSTSSAPLLVARSNSSGNSVINTTRNSLLNRTNSVIGAIVNILGDISRFQNGEISEIIIFNRQLETANRRIINAYLAGKYNLPNLTNFYNFAPTFNSEIFGIGRESDGANTSAQGSGIVEISNASTLGNGDYMIIGHDNGSLTTTTSVGSVFANNRYNRIWRVDVTNTPGTVDIKFELAGNNFAADPTNSYRLLIDNVSGSFDNSGITQALTGTYNAIDETITFTGVSLTDGDFFTLGERTDVITAVASTDWNITSTWDCSCIPTSTDNVVIPSPFTVSINGANALAGSLTIDAGGSLSFITDNALSLSNDFLIDGSISMSTGKFTFDGTDAQEIWNNSGSLITFNDLEFNNTNNVSLKAGNFEVNNFVTVTAGQLINDGAVFTFISDASNHSQITTSHVNGFSGRFIMERFFTSRAANYADITTSVVSTTVGDWDQEIFMSGVGGADGNVQDGPGGPVENTVWKYDNAAQSWVAVTDTNTTITAGEPIELFLGDNLTTFSAQTMDSKGTPFTGPRSFNLSTGFNFIGNPYRSFINYTGVPKPSGVNNQFYIYQQNVGAYSLFTGGFIASEQGFWINSPGARTITFNESNKFPLNFNQILRQKNDPVFELKITNLENNFGNKVSFVATSNVEDNAAFLPSPEKTSPALTIQLSDQQLIQQALMSTENSVTTPLNFYAGVDGTYTIAANAVDQLSGNYNCIVLEDKAEAKLIDLTVTDSYTFSTLKGDYERFNVHFLKSSSDCEQLFRTKGAASIATTNTIQFVQRGNLIELAYNLEEGTQAQLDILSLNGQKALPSIELSINGNGKEIIFNNTELKGIYLFVLRTDNKVITEKFRFN